MRRNRMLTTVLALLLCLGLLSGCGTVSPKAEVTPEPTPDTRVTLAPTETEKPSASPTAAPTPTPAAEPSPEPTPEPTPEPVRISALPEELQDSAWWMYAADVDGTYVDFVESGVDEWLEFYPDGPLVNWYERMWDEEWTELRALDVMQNGEGDLCFFGEVDGLPTTFTLTTISEWELELSVEWENPDGTAGSSIRWFNRANDFMDGRRMDQNELADFVNQLEPRDWGFFHDTYAYPQEISWDIIGSGGLGIAVDVPLAEAEDWRYYDGMAEDDVPVGLMQEDLEALCWEKTGTDYNEGENRILWWYWSGEDTPWVNALNPIYLEAPEIFDGYRLGDRCRLYFTLPHDPAAEAEGLESQTYVITMVLAPAGWQFRSCSVAGQVEPEVLASVRFFTEKAEAKRETGVTTFLSTEHLDSDEPNWVWAVITAQTDGVEYYFWRANMEDEQADAFEALIGEKSQGTLLSSGELEEGGCIALEVNLAWYPRLRLELRKDYHWAEYWFGEDNYIHLDPSTAIRYIAGHDLDGEGRGCEPHSERELVNVLTDRTWQYLGDTGEFIRACLQFYRDGETDIILPDTWYSMQAEFFHLETEDYDAPDAMRLYVNPDGFSEWSGTAEADGPVWIGDYQIFLVQTPGQQFLTLCQIGDTGDLDLLLPGAEDGEIWFSFTRYIGTTPYTPVG